MTFLVWQSSHRAQGDIGRLQPLASIPDADTQPPRRLPMKTFFPALMLAVTAMSGVVVASHSAFAGGKGGVGGGIDPRAGR